LRALVCLRIGDGICITAFQTLQTAASIVMAGYTYVVQGGFDRDGWIYRAALEMLSVWRSGWVWWRVGGCMSQLV